MKIKEQTNKHENKVFLAYHWLIKGIVKPFYQFFSLKLITDKNYKHKLI